MLNWKYFLNKLFISITIYISYIRSQTLDDVKRLQITLLDGYRKKIIPMKNQTVQLNVDIVCYLSLISSFSEVEETLNVIIAFKLNWVDQSLIWDPVLHGNVQTILLFSSEIWTPSLFLVNKVADIMPIGDNSYNYVYVANNGSVEFTTGGLLKVECPTDISKFPFDTQKCILRMAMIGLHRLNVNLTSRFRQAQLDLFTPHSDWVLEGHANKIDHTNGHRKFLLELTMKRKSLYHAALILLPTLMFSFVNPFVFTLSVESGERMSLTMTILLSFTIFLTLVSDSIPKTSNPMCVLLAVLLAIILDSGLIVVGVIISVKVYFMDDIRQHGGLLKHLVFILKRTRTIVSVDQEMVDVITGKDVSKALDTLFFYGTYVAIGVIFLGYFIYIMM